MRSFFKRPGAALFAVAALFTVVTTASTANALTIRGIEPVATLQNGPESVQTVAVSRWDAWQARRDVARALRDDCRQGDTRNQRRECFREARDQLREMQQNAREAYGECRNGGGSRYDCRQSARQYWVDQASGGDTGGGDTGGGSGEVTDDLPQ